MSGFYRTSGANTAPARPATEPAVPYLPTNSGEADGLVRDLLTIMQEMALMARPTMATILAVNGGELVVHLDDERVPRTIGFARTKGVQYLAGDRVKVSLLRNDEYVVDGLADAEPTDRTVHRGQIAVDAVGPDELADRSVSNGHLTAALEQRIFASITEVPTLGPGSILGGHIAAGQINSSHVGLGALGGWNIADGTITRRQLGAGAVGAENVGEGFVTWLSNQLASPSNTAGGNDDNKKNAGNKGKGKGKH